MRIKQQISTKHDRSGNPRRLLVIYSNGITDEGDLDIESVHDLGYGGRGSEPDEARSIPSIPSVFVSPSEYNKYVRMGAD